MVLRFLSKYPNVLYLPLFLWCWEMTECPCEERRWGEGWRQPAIALEDKSEGGLSAKLEKLGLLFFKLQRAAGENRGGAGASSRSWTSGGSQKEAWLPLHLGIHGCFDLWLPEHYFFSRDSDHSSSNPFADSPSLTQPWNAGFLQSSASPLFSSCVTHGAVFFHSGVSNYIFQISLWHL